MGDQRGLVERAAAATGRFPLSDQLLADWEAGVGLTRGRRPGDGPRLASRAACGRCRWWSTPRPPRRWTPGARSPRGRGGRSPAPAAARSTGGSSMPPTTTTASPASSGSAPTGICGRCTARCRPSGTRQWRPARSWSARTRRRGWRSTTGRSPATPSRRTGPSSSCGGGSRGVVRPRRVPPPRA